MSPGTAVDLAACGPNRGQPPLDGRDSPQPPSTGYPHRPETRGRTEGQNPISLTPNEKTPPNMAAVKTNHISEAPAVEAINGVGRGRPSYPHSARETTAERLADEAPLAVGAVLFEAHERARRLESQLELEAADPRVEALFRDSKALRKSIAGLLVEVAIDAAEEVVPAA